MTDKPDQVEVASAIQHVVQTLKDGDLALQYRVEREGLDDRHLAIILQQVAWQKGEIERLKTSRDGAFNASMTHQGKRDGDRNTISKQQRKINAMRETMDHIHTRLASLKSSVKNKASQIARLNGLLKIINEAIDAGGLRISECLNCNTPVVTIPVGEATCEDCAVDAAE